MKSMCTEYPQNGLGIVHANWKAGPPSQECYYCSEKYDINAYVFCYDCPVPCSRFCNEKCFKEVHGVAGNHKMNTSKPKQRRVERWEAKDDRRTTNFRANAQWTRAEVPKTQQVKTSTRLGALDVKWSWLSKEEEETPELIFDKHETDVGKPLEPGLTSDELKTDVPNPLEPGRISNEHETDVGKPLEPGLTSDEPKTDVQNPLEQGRISNEHETDVGKPFQNPLERGRISNEHETDVGMQIPKASSEVDGEIHEIELDSEIIQGLALAYLENDKDPDLLEFNAPDLEYDGEKVNVDEQSTISELFQEYSVKVLEEDNDVETEETSTVVGVGGVFAKINDEPGIERMGLRLKVVGSQAIGIMASKRQCDSMIQKPTEIQNKMNKPTPRSHSISFPGLEGKLEPNMDIVKSTVGEPEPKAKLMNIKDDAAVKAYNFVQERRIYVCKVTRVTSPSDFYIEFQEECYNCYSQKFLFEEMQEFYSEPYHREQHKVTTVIYNQRSYVFETEDKRWERVRVFKVKPQYKRAKIYFCDQGHVQWVQWDELLELHPKFATHHAFAFCCELTDMVTPNGDTEWPKGTAEIFRDLVQDKIFHTIIATRDNSHFINGGPESDVKMSVVLVPKDSSAKNTIQVELVKMGLAKGTGQYMSLL